MLPRSSFFILSSSLLLLLAACEDTLQNSLPATGDGLPVTLTLDSREEGAATRTGLENADPTHQVQQVEILIFEGKGDDAQCIDTETIKTWPKEQNSLTYTLQHPFVEGQTYTLLGVGKDDKFSDTYEIEQNNTLRQTYAKLKESKSKDDIATCEFFTGTVTFTHQGRGTQIDDLTMRRRVAGVMLYVTEIPQKVGDKRVTSVRLELGSNQKSSVLLKRDFTNPEWREPDGQDGLEDSKTLAQINLSGYTYTEGQDFYMEEGEPATGYAGVYMLPLNKTENVNTFTVKLYGKEVDKETEQPTGEETELNKSFTVTNHNANSTTFDIRSNYIYCIGKKGEGIDEPISLSGKPIYLDVTEWTIETNNPTFESARVQALFDDTDNPIHNCMNEEITIKILPPLETIRKYVRTITLSIDGNSYSLDDKGQEVVENTQGDAGGRWLYIKDGTTYLGNLDITSQVKDNGGEVTLLMLDYAKPRQTWGWNIDNTGKQWNATAEQIDFINRDVRYTDVYLTTYMEWDKNGNSQIEESEKITKTDVLTIKQYNTITVYYKGEDNDGDEETEEYSLCGFSRKDYTEGATLTFGWGFWNSNNHFLYPPKAPVPDYTGSFNTGAENLNAIFDGTAWGSGWDGSAIQKSLYSFKKVNANGTLTEEPIVADINDDNDKTNVGWCLPARYELEGFMIMCADRSQAGAAVEGNVPDNTPYWTSTTNGGPAGDASIAYQIENKSGNRTYVYIESDRGNHDAYRIRQVRKFSDYYNGEW